MASKKKEQPSPPTEQTPSADEQSRAIQENFRVYEKELKSCITDLDRMGLTFQFHQPAHAEYEIDEKTDITEHEKQELRQLLKKRLFRLADVCFDTDRNIFIGLQIYRHYRNIDAIKQRLQKGIYTRGFINSDLVKATLDFEEEVQSEQALHTLIQAGMSPEPCANTAYMERRMKPIKEAYRMFARKHHLPETIPEIYDENDRCLYINAAMELRKRGYDLAIGVLNSGIKTAQLLDFFGQATKYAEWHRDWKQPPAWRNIGGGRKPETQTGKILLCEHDTNSGATLKALIPFLQKLKPRQVDVVVQLDVHQKAKSNIEALGYYTGIELVQNIPYTNFIANLNQAAEYARSVLGQGTPSE